MSIGTLPAPAPSPVVSSSLDEAAGQPRDRGQRWAVLLGVLVLSVAYVYWHLGRGLLPHDDGAIGHASERLLRGELPHRDFDDIYTGGLAWLNGVAFRVLGSSIRSMRLMLLAAFALWVPAVFYIATRFARPAGAALITLLAVVWSVPNYPAPMPSWYNLFLATAGVACLMRHLERPNMAWLVAAGVAGGASILMKVVGLYYVAGVLLALVYDAHVADREEAGATPVAAPAYALFVTVALAAFVAALVSLVRRQATTAEVVHFVLPGGLIAGFIAHQEWTRPAGASRTRVASLARRVLPFLLGVVIPIAIFVAPYVASDALPALVNGVFILPTRRFGAATRHVAPLGTMLALLPFAVIFVLARRGSATLQRILAGVLAAILILVVVVAGSNSHVYRFAWNALYTIVPVLTVIGIVSLRRDGDGGATPGNRVRLMLLVAVTALCSLVQFPFAAPIYLCYVLPLAFLTLLAIHARLRPIPPPLAMVIGGFFLVFAVARVNTSSLKAMGVMSLAYDATAPLPLERAGVDVVEQQRHDYVAIDQLLREHARGGYTWASPDSPEIYFLSGLRNPTRTMFDFFDDPRDRTRHVLSSLERHGVTAVVLNRNPEFSLPIANDMFDALVLRFPASADVGHFQVRWR